MATLRSKQTGKEAKDGRSDSPGRGAGQARSGARVEARGGEAPGGTTREWLIARARQRIESGFYEDPLILAAAVHGIMTSERQSGAGGTNSPGV